MKKSLIYTFVLAASLVACTDDYTDWADPQHNDPETAQSVDASLSSVPVIKFAELTSDQVALFTPAVITGGSPVDTYKVLLKNDGGKTVELSADAEGKVLTSSFKDAVSALYGKRPTERTIPAEVTFYVDVDDQTVKKAQTVEVKALPAFPVVIEDSYYLLLVGKDGKTDFAQPIKFNHSTADVYDDPIFSYLIKAPTNDANDDVREDFIFRIAPESAMSEKNLDKTFGCDAAEASKGTLKEAAANAMKMSASDGAKFYRIELNMETREYAVTPLSFEEYIYVTGDHQGWKPDIAPSLASHNFDGIYVGYTYLNSAFKFTKARNWNEGEYNYGSFADYSANFSGEGTGNIQNATPGYYRLEADIPAGKLNAIPVEWGLIGSATPDGWDKSTPMTLNEKDATWSVTVTLSDNFIKFRANDGWDYNFGGDVNNLTPGGADIKVAAGTYKITLNLNDASHYFCTIEKQ